MRFCILYNTEYYPEAHKSASHYYGQILDQSELADSLGYDAVWFGEHHYDGYSFGNPALLATACATRTKHVKLGTGVSLIPFNHPIRLAEEFAMLDVLSGGRVEYGIGRGYLKYTHQVFGIADNENIARYQEGTDLILKAWTSEGRFSFDGKFWKLRDFSFFPKPIQKPYPPIYAAGSATPSTFEWAGRMGFNMCLGTFLPDLEKMRSNLGIYRDALIQNGHDPAQKEIGACYQLYCAPDEESAYRDGLGHMLRYMKFMGGLFSRGNLTSKDFEHLNKSISEMAAITPEMVRTQNLSLIGSPETIIKRIKWAEEFFGANYMIMEVAQGGMPHKLVVESIERFAAEVMPHFKKHTASDTKDIGAGN